MNNKYLAAACLLAVFAVAGCKPDSTDDAAADQPVIAPTDMAQPEIDTSDPTLSQFDTKGFAGNFAGTLPCEDCAGIDVSLDLKPDGSYQMIETYQGKSGKPEASDGSWSAEADDQHIRLDPNSKSAEDRVFAIVSPDTLEQLDMEGNPIDSAAPHSLQRKGG